MKKDTLKITLVISLMLIEVVSIFLTSQSYLSKPKEDKLIRSNKSYAIMLEDKDHIGTYNEYPENTWPGVGYILNIEMSSCVDSAGKEMEGLLTFDNEERIATVKSKKETYCYLYFKYDPAPVEISGFSITPVKVNNGKKYTNLEKNHVTLDWTDDDIQYFCLTESEERARIACEDKWVKSNGANHVEVDYEFENTNNEDKKVYAYTKDFGGSPSPRKDELINYDTTGPTITPSASGTKNSETNSWYKEMNITLTGDDGIGIGMQNIKYCITTSNSCTPDKTLNGGSGVVPLPTDSGNQKVCYQGEDLLGQKGAANTCMSTTYQVDGSKPGITFNDADKQAGDNGWMKRVVVKASGSDTGSGVGSLKTCVTTGTTCNPSSTAPNNQLGDKNVAQKVCAEVIDKAGNSSGIICSNTYIVDGTAPICGAVSKTGGVGSTIGVSGNVGCTDSTSGCTSTTFGFTNFTGTANVTIRDRAGNTQNCSVPIKIDSQLQTRTLQCTLYRYAQNSACGRTSCPNFNACGCAPYNWYKKYLCMDDAHLSYSIVKWGYGYPAGDCTFTGVQQCTQAASCVNDSCAWGSCRTAGNGCDNSWGNATAWTNVNSCVESQSNTTKVECRNVNKYS